MGPCGLHRGSTAVQGERATRTETAESLSSRGATAQSAPRTLRQVMPTMQPSDIEKLNHSRKKNLLVHLITSGSKQNTYRRLQIYLPKKTGV